MHRFTPEQAVVEMRRICAEYVGDAKHKAADDFMCLLMRQQGFGSAAGLFLETVDGYHERRAA